MSRDSVHSAIKVVDRKSCRGAMILFFVCLSGVCAVEDLIFAKRSMFIVFVSVQEWQALSANNNMFLP